MAVIYLLGDSTVEEGNPPFRGWGWALQGKLDIDVRVENHAIGGRSTKSFLAEGRFQPVLEAMKPGDLLMIQFGHNDEKDDAERHTDPYDSFTRNLNIFCDGAIAHGAKPVLITPPCRRYFAGESSLLYTHGEYAPAIRQLARIRNLPLCDLEMMTRKLFLSLGREKTAELFVRIPVGVDERYPQGHDDMTHFNQDGAGVIAGLVAEWMREQPGLI